MIDTLKKARELAMLFVLGGFALVVLVRVIQFVIYGLKYDFLDGAGSYSTTFVDPGLAVAAVAVLVAGALAEPLPRLRLYALITMILVALSTGIGLILSLVGLGSSGLAFNLATIFVVIGYAAVLAAAFLVALKIYRAAPKPAPAARAAYPQQHGQFGQLAPNQPQHGGQWGQPAQGQQPVWQPDQAAGASWGSAQDAAAGNAGTWGGAGQTGWQPQQQPDWQGAQGGQPQQPDQPGQQHPHDARGYPQSHGSAGFPHDAGGYPQSQGPAGFPHDAGGYPQSQGSAQPAQSDPPAAWEDDPMEDRTRLTPRAPVVDKPAPTQPADPQHGGQQWGQQPPEWGHQEPHPEQQDPRHGQWAPQNDPQQGYP
ncbi:MAG: hypothetical protein ACR2I1_08950, partial [Propionibacteriaceae bacterium]